MTPEQLNARIQELQDELNLLKAAATIPFEVEQAFSTRLKNTFAAGGITTDAKGATSESIAVNTAAGTLVQLAPDLFLKTTIGGTIYYIPVYT